MNMGAVMITFTTARVDIEKQTGAFLIIAPPGRIL